LLHELGDPLALAGVETHQVRLRALRKPRQLLQQLVQLGLGMFDRSDQSSAVCKLYATREHLAR
jgi:hypothetical protein